MGFSLSAAAAIIGVGVFLSVQYIASDVIPSVTDTQDSFEDMKNRAVDQFQTNINITSVVNTSSGPLYNLSVNVKNTGSVTLEMRYFDVLVNGSAQDFTYVDSYLYPEKETVLSLANQPNRGKLKVVTDNGISDYYEYLI